MQAGGGSVPKIFQTETLTFGQTFFFLNRTSFRRAGPNPDPIPKNKSILLESAKMWVSLHFQAERPENCSPPPAYNYLTPLTPGGVEVHLRGVEVVAPATFTKSDKRARGGKQCPTQRAFFVVIVAG